MTGLRIAHFIGHGSNGVHAGDLGPRSRNAAQRCSDNHVATALRRTTEESTTTMKNESIDRSNDTGLGAELGTEDLAQVQGGLLFIPPIWDPRPTPHPLPFPFPIPDPIFPPEPTTPHTPSPWDKIKSFSDAART